MSVVGIDFGAQSTKIGVARNKGIDIVCNSESYPSNYATDRLQIRRSPMRSQTDRHRTTPSVPVLLFVD